MRKSADIVANAIGTNNRQAVLALSAFHSREGRQDVSNALKHKREDDALYDILSAMREETSKSMNGESMFYRRYHGTAKKGEHIDIYVPHGDVWHETRNAVRGKAVRATFSPGDVVSIASRGTGFGDPFAKEVVVVGGGIKTGEVI